MNEDAIQHDNDAIQRAARAIASADAILIGAGAGMGVDGGLPDFRGREGFWNAYPPYARLGLDFQAMASPRWFRDDPELAWGFYGHRLELYRATAPHPGYAILKQWTERASRGGFVVTSNVDGHFQRAGFDPERVYEVHGAIDTLQCAVECGEGLFPADDWSVTIDEETMRAVGPLPSCPRCGELARPNILMFGDWGWDSSRSDAQERNLRAWFQAIRVDDARLVVIECGAGTAVPTIRMFCQNAIEHPDALLIRINTREPRVPPGHVSIPERALKALRAIDQALESPDAD